MDSFSAVSIPRFSNAWAMGAGISRGNWWELAAGGRRHFFSVGVMGSRPGVLARKQEKRRM